MSAPIGDDDWDDRRVPFGSGAQLPSISDLLGQSTSAQLRRMQSAFAASQADLTHIEHQLREAEAERMKAERERAESVEWWRQELHLAEAELVTARAELELLRKNEEIRAQVIRELRAELADRKGGTNG